jgi:hypothetical protein
VRSPEPSAGRRNVSYIDEMTREPERKHECPGRPPNDDEEHGPRPAPAYWGAAISQIGYLGGRWWAISGRMPPEYATPIRFCPWCGIDLADEEPPAPTQRRQRRRNPECRQENDLSREEMVRLGSRGAEEPRFHRKRPPAVGRGHEDDAGGKGRSEPA